LVNFQNNKDIEEPGQEKTVFGAIFEIKLEKQGICALLYIEKSTSLLNY